MHEVVGSLAGVAVVMDDILVWGKTRQEHDTNLTALLERCRERNLKLNKKKCQFLQASVRYMGHLLTAEGLSLDPERVHDIMQVPPPKNRKELQLLSIRTETDKDTLMTELCRYASTEWPKSKQQLPDALKPYWSYRDELHVEDGLLLTAVRKLSRTTAAVVINASADIFATHGIPAKLCTDNGPPFNSATFQAFTGQFNIRHTTSSPYHPRANGFSERAVQEAKLLLNKCPFSTLEFYSALFEWRNTPRDEQLQSPAQRLMGCHTRSQLPVLNCHLEPKTIRMEAVRQRLQEIRHKQRSYYNRTTRALPDLGSGNRASVYDTQSRTWAPAMVIVPAGPPRSHLVATDSGQQLRRTREHLRATDAAQPVESQAETRRQAVPTAAFSYSSVGTKLRWLLRNQQHKWGSIFVINLLQRVQLLCS
ncbi:uncharacterized protein LOC142591589 [Dermacentor variabilis]|uniref:uncharacterized protein LOC142591589 n=1 Tax=Dermacentor variabilis TaxID=34621 RepID=UPI003F5B3A29